MARKAVDQKFSASSRSKSIDFFAKQQGDILLEHIVRKIVRSSSCELLGA